MASQAIDFNQLTIAQVRELQSFMGGGSGNNRMFETGEVVFIRTVTHYSVGKVVYENDAIVKLDPGAWVASTGRWTECLEKGKLEEVEPYVGPVRVSKASIVDICSWKHDIPTQAK